MKVTAGKLKGRKLIENTYDHIRPSADVVKQSIFNKLFLEVEGAKVLDLFAGTGALGIEAYSRGAEKVVLVDKDYRSIKLIRDNLISLNISNENIRIIKASYEDALKKLKDEKFDIILVDPPYKAGLYEKAISFINQYDSLSDDGIVVCEHDKKDKFDYSPFEVYDEKIYGTKMVTYLKKSI